MPDDDDGGIPFETQTAGVSGQHDGVRPGRESLVSTAGADERVWMEEEGGVGDGIEGQLAVCTDFVAGLWEGAVDAGRCIAF